MLVTLLLFLSWKMFLLDKFPKKARSSCDAKVMLFTNWVGTSSCISPLFDFFHIRHHHVIITPNETIETRGLWTETMERMIQLLQVSFKGWQLFPVVFLCLKFWSKYNQNGNKNRVFKSKHTDRRLKEKCFWKQKMQQNKWKAVSVYKSGTDEMRFTYSL